MFPRSFKTSFSCLVSTGLRQSVIGSGLVLVLSLWRSGLHGLWGSAQVRRWRMWRCSGKSQQQLEEGSGHWTGDNQCNGWSGETLQEGESQRFWCLLVFSGPGCDLMFSPVSPGVRGQSESRRGEAERSGCPDKDQQNQTESGWKQRGTENTHQADQGLPHTWVPHFLVVLRYLRCLRWVKNEDRVVNILVCFFQRMRRTWRVSSWWLTRFWPCRCQRLLLSCRIWPMRYDRKWENWEAWRPFYNRAPKTSRGQRTCWTMHGEPSEFCSRLLLNTGTREFMHDFCDHQWGGSKCERLSGESEGSAPRSSESSDGSEQRHPAGVCWYPEHQQPVVLRQYRHAVQTFAAASTMRG